MELSAEIKFVGAIAVNEEGDEAPAVILEAGGRYLPILVTNDQAQSIEIGMSEKQFERPLTHELLLGIINEMGGALDKILIDDLMDGTFFAKIYVERYNNGERERFEFDARPSDAVALAARTKCPIDVSKELMEKAGKQADEI